MKIKFVFCACQLSTLDGTLKYSKSFQVVGWATFELDKCPKIWVNCMVD